MVLPLLVSIAVLSVVAAALAPPPVGRLVQGTQGGPEMRVLFIRFVERSRRFRRLGALAGFMVAMSISVVLDNELDGGWRVDGGIVPLAAIALAGSIGGSLLAEGFRLRRPRGARTASLEPRDPLRYADAVAAGRERWVLGASAAALLAAVLSGSPGLGVVLAVAALGLAALRRWATRRVALRPRPAVPARLIEADDEVRRLAVSAGISRPIVMLMALLAAAQWQLAGDAVVDSEGGALGDVAELVADGASLMLLAASGWWWWQNRWFGLEEEPHRSAGWRDVAPGALSVFVALTAVALVAGFVVLARTR